MQAYSDVEVNIKFEEKNGISFKPIKTWQWRERDEANMQKTGVIS